MNLVQAEVSVITLHNSEPMMRMEPEAERTPSPSLLRAELQNVTDMADISV